MYKAMISSFALLMHGAVSAVAQETASPAAATTAVQEAPAPVNTGEIKLKPAIDVAVPCGAAEGRNTGRCSFDTQPRREASCEEKGSSKTTSDSSCSCCAVPRLRYGLLNSSF